MNAREKVSAQAQALREKIIVGTLRAHALRASHPHLSGMEPELVYEQMSEAGQLAGVAVARLLIEALERKGFRTSAVRDGGHVTQELTSDLKRRAAFLGDLGNDFFERLVVDHALPTRESEGAILHALTLLILNGTSVAERGKRVESVVDHLTDMVAHVAGDFDRAMEKLAREGEG